MTWVYCSTASHLRMLGRTADGLCLRERRGDGWLILWPCGARGEVCS
jgi:hypothetical protein